MRYLLDVNALIALGITRHQFRDRVLRWLSTLAVNETPRLSTCSITELGFVRIVSQIPEYGVTVEQAKTLLAMLRSSTEHDLTFLADTNDVSNLPAWVNSPKQTTDGHLVELAKSNGCVLATLDEGIPGAFVVPDKITTQ